MEEASERERERERGEREREREGERDTHTETHMVLAIEFLPPGKQLSFKLQHPRLLCCYLHLYPALDFCIEFVDLFV